MSKEWFILQFKPNSQHQAVKNLNRQGFETFLPLHNTTSRKLSRFINASKPLFPGYMFVRFDKTEYESIVNKSMRLILGGASGEVYVIERAADLLPFGPLLFETDAGVFVMLLMDVLVVIYIETELHYPN